jgi:hypothetical protein
MDIVNLEEDTKLDLLLNTDANDFTKEFLKRLGGERTIDTYKFKELVKLQDELYDVSAKEMAPKIWDYVNA